MKEINIYKVLDFIRDNAPKYAQAKAERIYCDEYRKTLKSQLFFEALEEGFKTIAEREAYAYSHKSYLEHLEALKQAVTQEETLRWQLVAAQAKVECWRSIESSNRMIDRAAQ